MGHETEMRCKPPSPSVAAPISPTYEAELSPKVEELVKGVREILPRTAKQGEQIVRLESELMATASIVQQLAGQLQETAARGEAMEASAASINEAMAELRISMQRAPQPQPATDADSAPSFGYSPEYARSFGGLYPRANNRSSFNLAR